MSIIGIALMVAGLAIAALVLCLIVREQFLADPDLGKTDWERNAWLKDKRTLLGMDR